ncbi:hypothetical protein HDU91_007379 [Kappamyces sp. JEL0680]|nr:hypothetical protein HDU91_007379 [Kappamyces sp. JEL0680]
MAEVIAPLQGKPARAKKPKRNAQDVWAGLETTNDAESVAGSTCSSHISLVRVPMSKEVPMEHSTDKRDVDALSDLLQQLVEVEKRGIDILNSREDLMSHFTSAADIYSPPPGQSDGYGEEAIPQTSETFTQDLMQSIAMFKAANANATATKSPISSPGPVRTAIKPKEVKDDAVVVAADGELEEMLAMMGEAAKD